MVSRPAWRVVGSSPRLIVSRYGMIKNQISEVRGGVIVLRRWRHNLVTLAVGSVLVLLCRSGLGADDGALLNALLREGVLTQKQVDRVRQDMDNQNAVPDQGLLGKIKIPGAWVQEIDVYGDLRLRDYFVQQQQQLGAPPSSMLAKYDVHNPQQNRFRFRLRLNMDFKLAGGFLVVCN